MAQLNNVSFPETSAAFDHFDPAVVATYGKRKPQSLLADAGIIRNRLKVEAAIQNARAFLVLQQEFETFDEVTWRNYRGD